MSGPHIEDELFGMTSDEVARLLAPIEMQGGSSGRDEVAATLRAHSATANGHCRSCGEMDPCGTRLYQETVLSRMNRQEAQS